MIRSKKVEKTCASCKLVFFVPVSVSKKGWGKFCSRNCRIKAYKHTEGFGVGETNPNWKGGLTQSKKGYWYVHLPDNPRANKNGYVKRADLVLEGKLGRPLTKGEIAHHKNEIKGDDSPENLELMTLGAHARLHHPKTRVQVRNPAHPSNKRYDWPPIEELRVMVEMSSLRRVALDIGCNHKTLHRRLARFDSFALHH